MKNTTHFLSEDAVWESGSEFVSVVCRPMIDRYLERIVK